MQRPRLDAPNGDLFDEVVAKDLERARSGKGGRLVLNEPTSLPEGTEVELVPMDDVDELDDAERARLHGFLAESIRGHVPGTGIAAEDLLAELRVGR
jgi:hypothetical protein